jgi:hypothetical protein
VTGCAALLFAVPASAQFFGNGQQPTLPQQTFSSGTNGANAVIPGTPQFTPQQLQSMMIMRAMQGGMRNQVRTGIPQNIPLGNTGMMGGPAPVQTLPSASATTQKSSGNKKDNARASREEKKRAAKEAAKAKKEKAKKKAKSKDDDTAAAS